MKESKFKLETRKKFFTVKVVKHWHQGAGGCPNLGNIQGRFGQCSEQPGLAEMSLFTREGSWEKAIIKVHSNPNYSMI